MIQQSSHKHRPLECLAFVNARLKFRQQDHPDFYTYVINWKKAFYWCFKGLHDHYSPGMEGGSNGTLDFLVEIHDSLLDGCILELLEARE